MLTGIEFSTHVFWMCIFSQACVTYENFMTNLAKLIRTDRHLEVNDTNIREEVSRVMMMEKEIANVSMKTFFNIQTTFEQS